MMIELTRKIRTIILFILGIVVLECTPQAEKNVHPALQMQQVPAGLGVNIHFYEGNENDLAMLDESGVGIVRMDVSWQSAEKKAGEYDFSHYDTLIRDLEQRNIRLLFIIDYGNPLYDDGLAPHTDAGRRAYVKFCEALARRYKDKDIIWELWNEPNYAHFWKPNSDGDAYMAWCHAVVPAIRNADPNACIIAPAVSRIDLPFLESCFKRGLLELVDGVSVHPYRNPHRGTESIFNEIGLLSILIEQYRPDEKNIPIVSGEWGYSTTHLSRELQGKYLARQWLFNMAHNIPVSIWYDWHDDGKDADNAEHNFGTVTWEYQPKEAFMAMKTLTHELQGAIPMCRIHTGSMDDYLVVFSTRKGIVLALWTSGEVHGIDLGPGIHVDRCVDYLGRQQTRIHGTEVEISDEPVYLKLGDSIPAWLELIKQAFEMNRVQAEQFVQAFLRQDSSNYTTHFIHTQVKAETEVADNAVQAAIFMIADKVENKDAPYYGLMHWLMMENNTLTSKQAIRKVTALGSTSSETWVSMLRMKPELMQDVATYYLHMAYQHAAAGNIDDANRLLMKAIGTSSQRYWVDRVLDKLKEHGSEIEPAAQRELAKTCGFINQWWIAGPFPNDNHSARTTSYFPEKQIDIAQTQTFDSLEARWQKIDLDGIYAIIPFAKIYGKKQGAAYAYTEIFSPFAGQLQLKIGSNDGVVCWLNGEKVHENLIGRSLTVDEDVVPVQFKQGRNRLLLKVLNHGLNWEACVRVCNKNGVPLDLNQISTKK